MIRKGQGPRQTSLLLVGSGRLARHLRFYFSELGFNFQTWSRAENDEASLRARFASADHVLLAIRDDAIASFVERHRESVFARWAHFSGALDLDGVASLHPLMSFGPELYPREIYPRIHFAVTGITTPQEILPGLPNPFSVLAPEKKALYHALCVLGGNLPVLLWHKMESSLGEFGLPKEASRLYIERVAANYVALGERALTGPLVRKDQQTIEKNLNALEGDPWRKIYQAFQEVMS